MPHTFGVTDSVSYLRQDSPSLPATRERVRIQGFYKFTDHTLDPSMRFLLEYDEDPTARRMVPCGLDDPDFGVVNTYAICGQMHRPWELTWESPIRWSAEHIASERASWERRLAEGYNAVHRLSSRGYPSLFNRFPPLSEHDRMRVRAWVAHCRAQASAWVDAHL